MKKTFIYLIFTSFLGLFSSLFAGEIYVSPYGSDKNAGTKEAPFCTLERAIKQAREWRRLNHQLLFCNLETHLKISVGRVYSFRYRNELNDNFLADRLITFFLDIRT